jgi:methylamine utilization protein MauJ
MMRLEVAVNSPLAFSLTSAQLIDAETLRKSRTTGPDTVGIEFRGRLFVWHAFPSEERPGPGHEEAGPTVTVVLEPEEDEERVAVELERFVSAIAFAYQEPAVTLARVRTDGSEPYGPANFRAPRTPFWGYTLWPAPARIALRSDANVQLAVAYYREGLNATSPFYRFLALWNALEAAFAVTDRNTPEHRERNKFIREFESKAHMAWITATSVI